MVLSNKFRARKGRTTMVISAVAIMLILWFAQTGDDPSVQAEEDAHIVASDDPATVRSDNSSRDPAAAGHPLPVRELEDAIALHLPSARLIETRRMQVTGSILRVERLYHTPEGASEFMKSTESFLVSDGAEPIRISQGVASADQMIVQMPADLDPIEERRAEAWLEARGWKQWRRYSFSPVVQFRTTDVSLDRVTETLKAFTAEFDGVLRASEDWICFPTAVPDDPRYGNQWNMQIIDAESGWDRSTGEPEAIVAVIDTGVFTEHEDLAGVVWVNPNEVPGDGIDNDGNGLVDDVSGWDFVDNDAIPQDSSGHGTKVSGFVAAEGDNGLGVAGVGWNLSLLPLRAGASTFAWGTLAQCQDYVTSLREAGNFVTATNNSYGGYAPGYPTALPGDVLYEAIKRAGEVGILFVAGAGNNGLNVDALDAEGKTQYFYPASFDLPSIIAVAGTTSTDVMWSGSNYGAISIDIAAPGANVLSTDRAGSYSSGTGTSFASPHVAGLVGVIASYNPYLTPAEMRANVLQSGDILTDLSGKLSTESRISLAGALNLTATWPRVSWPVNTSGFVAQEGWETPVLLVTDPATEAVSEAVFQADGRNLTRDRDGSDGWGFVWTPAPGESVVYDATVKGANGKEVVLPSIIGTALDERSFWKHLYWGDGYESNPDAAETADPDGDGRPNGLEFFVASNPLIPFDQAGGIPGAYRVSSTEEPPPGESAPVEAGEYLLVEFQRNKRAVSSSYTYLGAPVLAPADDPQWVAITPVVEETQTSAENAEVEVVRAWFWWTPDAQWRFLRLKVL